MWIQRGVYFLKMLHDLPARADRPTGKVALLMSTEDTLRLERRWQRAQVSGTPIDLFLDRNGREFMHNIAVRAAPDISVDTLTANVPSP